MATDDEASAIIDKIYDVAVDPARYEAMLDVWERRLSVLRLRADADKQNRIVERGIEAHLDRAEIFLKRLTDTKTGNDRSALDIDVKASFLVGTHLLIDQVNRAAQEVFQLRVGDPLARLPLDSDDASVLSAAIRAVLATKDGPPTLMRFTSARSDRSIIFHIARQPKVDGQGLPGSGQNHRTWLARAIITNDARRVLIDCFGSRNRSSSCRRQIAARHRRRTKALLRYSPHPNEHHPG